MRSSSSRLGPRFHSGTGFGAVVGASFGAVVGTGVGAVVEAGVGAGVGRGVVGGEGRRLSGAVSGLVAFSGVITMGFGEGGVVLSRIVAVVEGSVGRGAGVGGVGGLVAFSGVITTGVGGEILRLLGADPDPSGVSAAFRVVAVGDRGGCLLMVRRRLLLKAVLSGNATALRMFTPFVPKNPGG